MNLQNMVHFCLALPVYACFMLADGLYPGWIWLPGIPLLAGVTLASVYGLSLFVGTLNLFLRDLGNLVAILTQAGFFATPIMYTLDVVPKEYHWCFQINPFAPLFICWRSLLVDNTVNMDFLPYALGYAALFLLCGALVFRKLHRRFAEVV
jgi:lipopolysaccharide transport system permease protein